MATHNTLRAQLINTLATSHTGAANGINAEALARKLGTDTRTLRSLVSEARNEGVAIASTPETGYYIARTSDELDQCCAFLRSRAMHSLRLESQLRRIPMPELLGQLHLPT